MEQETTGAAEVTAKLEEALAEETTEESPASETGTGGETTETEAGSTRS